MQFCSFLLVTCLLALIFDICTPKLMQFCSFLLAYLLTCLKFWIYTPKLMQFCSFLLVTCLLVEEILNRHNKIDVVLQFYLSKYLYFLPYLSYLSWMFERDAKKVQFWSFLLVTCLLALIFGICTPKLMQFCSFSLVTCPSTCTCLLTFLLVSDV